MKSYKGITVNGDCIEVIVTNSKISSIQKIDNDTTLPLIAIPLVDTQNNGALGYNFDNCADHLDKLPEIVKFYKAHGVGKMLLTTTTCDAKVLQNSGRELTKYLDNNSDINNFFSGVFHEGMYMSKRDGYRGAHILKYVKDPDYSEFSETNKAFNNKIKLVNIAPEEPGAFKFIENAVRDGIKVSIGHACPNAEEVAEAVKCGASMVTHFGNGADTMIHRHKNPFWSLLAHNELSIGIIADGHHLPMDLIKTVLKTRPKEMINLVSDCSSRAGMKAGDYNDFDCIVTIEKDGYLHIKDKEILAGAWHQLDKGVEVLCNIGWTLEDAWKQCSEIPANQFNINLDKLEVGADANFVLSSYTKNSGLTIKTVVANGEEIKALPVNPVGN